MSEPAWDPTQPPTLDNCDREPIHVPGTIQPHGALLAFDRLGRLTHMSANVPALLGIRPAFGTRLEQDPLGALGRAVPALREALQQAVRSEQPVQSVQADVEGRQFDVVIHSHQGRVLCEFEHRVPGEDVSAFALIAFRALETVKRQTSAERLLQTAVEAIRTITGFDRVMGYRFAHDDSGEVLAEARADTLDAYLGRRYPASDIPAQARRLYTVNTLRLIPDVGYAPVPVLSESAGMAALDMSHSILRSVSPVHVEYLGNMGVRASMSVSIVVGGRLWGLIACHHMAPRRVPYPLRMAIDVIAQVIASSLQSIAAATREAAVARAATVRTAIAQSIASGDEVVDAIHRERLALCADPGCDDLFFTLEGTPRLLETVDARWAAAVAQWLAHQRGDLVHVTAEADLPPWPDDVPATQRYSGLLGLRFDLARQGWLVLLRREQVFTIRWGGKPDKVIAHGPLGARLTPRGSFDEWRETVRGQAAPWTEDQREIASQLLDTVARAHGERLRQADAMRTQLWAILGHDLRNPLQSLHMASTALDRGASSERLNTIIRNSANRMNRLLSDVLDLARLQRGFDLNVEREALDLVPLLRQLIDEFVSAQPSTGVSFQAPPSLHIAGDAGRIAQLVANLLSNARHHGTGDVSVALLAHGDTAQLTVENPAEPIPDDRLATLFDPFKAASLGNQRNRTGMGLGLYIAGQVARAHGGSIDYRYAEGRVAFVVRLPAWPDAAHGTPPPWPGPTGA